MHKVHIGMIAAVAVVGTVAIVVESKANLDLSRQLEATLHSVSAPALVSPSATRNDAAELIELDRLQARIAELKSRPDGLVDSAIIRRADLRNVGRATLETLVWAALAQDYEVAAESVQLGAFKTAADAYFASLSPELRAKHRTPERLFVPYFLSGPRRALETVDAIQTIELFPTDRPDIANARV